MRSRRGTSQRRFISREDVTQFDKTNSQTKQLVTDMENLAKKSPDGAVSKFKLGLINEQLRSANRFVQPPFKPIDGFEEFDTAELPTNSDVVIVLSQYLTCLERWRSANIRRREVHPRDWIWNIEGEGVKTVRPTTATFEGDDGTD